MDAYYDIEALRMDFTLGTRVPAMWSTLLILTTPTVQFIPLWDLPLWVIDPPLHMPLGFPLSSVGWVGIWTGLFSEGGDQATDFSWIDTVQ